MYFPTQTQLELASCRDCIIILLAPWLRMVNIQPLGDQAVRQDQIGAALRIKAAYGAVAATHMETPTQRAGEERRSGHKAHMSADVIPDTDSCHGSVQRLRR